MTEKFIITKNIVNYYYNYCYYYDDDDDDDNDDVWIYENRVINRIMCFYFFFSFLCL